jgi:hypothetical protein
MGKEQVTMSRFESYASDESLQHFYFAREPTAEESDRAAALELVAATSALMSDWIAPLAVSVRVESCDPSHYYFEDDDHPPARPHWFLRRHELDPRLFITEVWIDSEERRVAAIGGAELLSLVQEALAQPPPLEHLEVTLAEVVVKATEVALPEGIELALTYGGGPLKPVLVFDGKRWLALGPDHGPVGPPARLRASNIHGRTTIGLELCWDFWREHPAGRAQARAAIERVLARGRGWQLEMGELP